MSRTPLLRPLAAALLLAAGAPALHAQDVVEAGRVHGVAPPAQMLEQLRQDPTAFEFQRAWRQRTARIRQQRAALEDREGPALSTAELVSGQAALTGTLRVPVLLGMYAGATAPYTQADYQTRLFGPQLYTAKTLYQEMSRGLFTLDGTVTPWLVLPQPAAYYEPAPGGDRFGNTGDFIRHSLDAADGQMNFGQFDNDGADGVPNSGDDDGYVDAAAFIYAGAGMACGRTGIWPHRWVYRAWTGGQPYTTNDARTGGGFIRVDDYLIQGGKECDDVSLMPIGTFAHEMGHALGLPDLYDTYPNDGSSQGLGEWDLMGSGNYRLPDAPTHMGAWSKDFLGWVNVETVTSTRTAYALPRVYDGGTVLRYDLPGTREYFLMEHRAAVLSDRNIRGTGLLVYHVDPVVIDSTSFQNRVNAHPRVGVALEEADGLGDLLAGRDRGDNGDVFPGSTARTTFGDTGTPNTRSNGGAPSGLELRNIALAGTQLSFDFVAQEMLVAPALVTLQPEGDSVGVGILPVSMTGGSAVAVSATRQGTWLTVTPAAGTTPVNLGLRARAQGLMPGVYHDTVTLTAAGAANSPLKVAVRFEVQARVLALGDSVGGTITLPGERDSVQVQLAAGDVIDMAVFDAGTLQFGPSLTLVTPGGAEQPGVGLVTGGISGVRRGVVFPGRQITTSGTYRLVVTGGAWTGDYVLKVRRAGPVPAVENASRFYLWAGENGPARSDTMWVYNSGAGSGSFTVTPAADAPWLTVPGGGTAAARPRAAAAGEASAAHAPLDAPAGEALTPPQPALPGSVPVVLTATPGSRAADEYVGHALVRVGDDWTGPLVQEVRLRVHESGFVLVNPDKLTSRVVAIAAAPEGDLGAVLADGRIVRMDPRTGSITPWATLTGTTWWGMAFGPDSSAYVAQGGRVARVTRGGVVSTVLTVTGNAHDVVLTPDGVLFVGATSGLFRVVPGGPPTTVLGELTYGVAYNRADGMIYASVAGGIRRVNPATGATTLVTVSDATVQQQLEIGAGGVMYGRTYYLDLEDLRRITPAGQVDRTWWTPMPFGQTITLAPDGTLYGGQGNRVWRMRVEGQAPPTHAAGDVTGDGAVTAQDALGVLSAAVGRTLPAGWTAAWGDANCDGQVTAQDALIILSHAVGKDVAQFCVGQPRP